MTLDGGTRGGFFSFDGVYPGKTGQALVANFIINEIRKLLKPPGAKFGGLEEGDLKVIGPIQGQALRKIYDTDPANPNGRP